MFKVTHAEALTGEEEVGEAGALSAVDLGRGDPVYSTVQYMKVSSHSVVQ